MSTRPLSAIREDAAALLARYQHAEPRDRTDLLREVAATLVDAREHFYTSTGSTDWRGKTYAYRRFVGEVFSEANVPQSDVPTIQGAIRYHVGNVLRERLDADTLADLGLRVESPKERSVEKRAGQSEALSLLRGGAALTSADEIAAAVRAASGVLSRVGPDAIRGLSAKERHALGDALTALADEARELADAGAAARRRR